MSFTPEPDKAEAARQEGNASFKKGKWTEAIGHYTTAIINNPNDVVPYTNRAAAYIKLEKYKDAERDCTSALKLSPRNVKALYRLGLCQKGLEMYTDSIISFEEVLKLGKDNVMVLNELEEVRELSRRQSRLTEKKNSKSLPPSPPRLPASITGDGIQSLDHEEKPTVEPSEKERHISTTRSESEQDQGAEVQQDQPAPSSFANLRKSRNERKTYISHNPSSTSIDRPTQFSIDEPTQSSSDKPTQSSSNQPSSNRSDSPKESIHPQPPHSTRPTQKPTPSSTKPSIQRPPTPPPNPSSLSPASGFNLLTKLSRLSPEKGWDYLTHYPPPVVPTILSPLLEPDSLGKLLLVLRHGVDQDPENVKTILEGLSKTSRWKINTAMLESREETAGKEAWEISGATGIW